jgi:hypothetical protein
VISGSASTSAADVGHCCFCRIGRHRPRMSCCMVLTTQQGNPSPFDPAGLLCMVAVDGGPLCVLAKCKEFTK